MNTVAEDLREGVPSRAALHGHPLHPMVVPFPIAFLTAALLTDIAYLVRGSLLWAEFSLWLLLAGLVMGVVAAILGLTDFLSDRRVRDNRVAQLHFAGNAIVLTLAAWNAALRWEDPAMGVQAPGIVLSAITVLLLVGTGWLGGELAYRHRVGMIGASRRRPLPEARTDTRPAAAKPDIRPPGNRS